MSSPSYSSTPTKQVLYCYNTNSTGCATAVVAEPITEVDAYTTLAGMSTSSRTQTQYDNYGNVTHIYQFDFGASSYSTGTSYAYGSWNGSACVAIGNNINDKPCQITGYENGNAVSQSRYTYGSHGNLLTTYVWTGSSWLSNPTANSYNSNGTIATSYDLAGNATTYGYNSSKYASCGSCTNYPFATSVTKGGLTTYSTWNGTGGVKLTDTDANGNVTTYGYANYSAVADPWWRRQSVTDPLGNETWTIYNGASSVETQFEFNSNNSLNFVYNDFDGYGRTVNVQKWQGPGAPYYDTVSTTYNFSGVNPTVFTSIPCSASGGSTCSTGATNTYDVLGRLVSSVDAGGGTDTITYSENDVLSVLSPAPSGENNKKVQKQYDGVGRLTSSCAISSTVSGNVSCAQNTGSSNGVLTTMSYASSSGSQTVSSTRGSQTRSQTLDGLSRATSVTTPEGGTTTYYYDSGDGCTSSAGHLVGIAYANGNNVCLSYDALGRVFNKVGTTSSGGYCVRFRYDSTSNKFSPQPSGSTISNVAGRLMEAETDSCTPNFTQYTDEWFSYDADGHMTDMWESTPNSGTYYHSTETFYGNGQPTKLTFVNPSGWAALNYGIDGEGRPNTFALGTGTQVSGVTYNAASQPTNIAIGTGTDYDGYSYDSVNRMTNWTFQVNSVTATGALTWSPNGTLKELAITDGFNSGGTQTCSFNSSLVTGTGYDDLGRLVGGSCGSSGSLWNQADSYDQYDNLTKSSTGFVSWNPGYSTTTNHYTCTGCTYDSSGNVTSDGTNTYTWNAFNKMASVNSNNLIYDALGRTVEIDNGSTYTEIWYTQLGKTAFMSGSTVNYFYDPAPGGGTLLETSSGTNVYLHKDWLGNARLASTVGGHSVLTDRAFAPYGEIYDIFGGTTQNYNMFTGNTQDVIAGMTDTPNRELQTSQQGRFLSPDPAGSGWNQYAYPTNPNSNTDPSGLGRAKIPFNHPMSPDTFDCYLAGC
ncbi:MAG: hypothetical protein WA555_16010 [Candidatus Sulfotelmatobacter sp.]